MTLEQVLTILASPVSVAAVGWWIKSNMAKDDQTNSMAMEIKVMQATLARIEAGQKRIETLNDSMIILKNETETQWKRIDEHKERLKDLERMRRDN